MKIKMHVIYIIEGLKSTRSSWEMELIVGVF